MSVCHMENAQRFVTTFSPFILDLPMTLAIVITYSVLPPWRSSNQTEYFPNLSFAAGLRVFEWLTVSAGKIVTS